MKKSEAIIAWIKNWFYQTGGKTAIIGISGGKDSTVAAALCVKALGKENVVGVMMPNKVQYDLDDSVKVIELLGIKSHLVNIGDAYSALTKEIFTNENREETYQSKTNLPARLRMATLYSVASMYPGARVCNTCNASEDYIGYSTKFGDSAGDFSPLSKLLVYDVLRVGEELGLPYDLVHKRPSDGMCGKSDEDNLGFSYAELDSYLRYGTEPDKEKLEKIKRLHKMNLHKLQPMPTFRPERVDEKIEEDL